MKRRTIYIIGSSIAILVPIGVLAATGISSAFPWAWVVTRAAGLASYALLALLTISGILQTTGIFYRLFSPATSWSIHRAIASTLLITVIIHLGGLLLDTFIGLKLADILIPFVSWYKPLFVALGILGFYLLLLILLTSLYTLSSHPKFWRTIHFLGFIMFLSVFLHGLLVGTDLKVGWVSTAYWITAIPVFLAVVYRLWWKYRKSAE